MADKDKPRPPAPSRPPSDRTDLGRGKDPDIISITDTLKPQRPAPAPPSSDKGKSSDGSA